MPTVFMTGAGGQAALSNTAFRIYPSNSLQAVFSANYAYEQMNARKVGILYTNNEWGVDLRDTFAESFKEIGGEIVFNEGVAPDATDARTAVSKLKQAKPDLIYLPMYPTTGLIAVKQIKEQGLVAPIFGSASFEADEVTQSPVSEGLIYTIGVVKNPEDFKARVLSETGSTSNVLTPLSYDALHILAHVMREVGTDKTAVIEALAALQYTEGISNEEIRFDDDGDLVGGSFEVKQVQDNAVIDYQS